MSGILIFIEIVTMYNVWNKMKKIVSQIFVVLSLLFVGCDDNDTIDYAHVDIIMQVSETTVCEPVEGGAQKVEYMLVKEPSDVEWKKLAMGIIDGFEYVRGHAYELKVRKTCPLRASAYGKSCTYKLIEVISDTLVQEQKPGELPEEAKFKFKMGQLEPFMHMDTPLPAPFDLLTFKIVDYQDEYDFLYGNAVFLQYYDSIVFSSPVMPDTYRVFQQSCDESGCGSSYISQWSSYFFEKSDFQLCLKGYKGGKVIYEYSMDQMMQERDFLCVDWTCGIYAMANPLTACIYCVLDSRYEFLLTDTQMRNDTYYVKIRVAPGSELVQSEYLKKQEQGLKWLLYKFLARQPIPNAADFKTLPEDADIVAVYGNSTTRAALIHHDDIDNYKEYYYVIAEQK